MEFAWSRSMYDGGSYSPMLKTALNQYQASKVLPKEDEKQHEKNVMPSRSSANQSRSRQSQNRHRSYDREIFADTL